MYWLKDKSMWISSRFLDKFKIWRQRNDMPFIFQYDVAQGYFKVVCNNFTLQTFIWLCDNTSYVTGEILRSVWCIMIENIHMS